MALTLSDSDTDTLEKEETLDQDIGGYRMVDISILNANIASQLLCAFCHGTVTLFEVSRKGLGSGFAFHCENPLCDRQQLFPSCPQIPAGNLQVHSVNRRTLYWGGFGRTTNLLRCNKPSTTC